MEVECSQGNSLKTILKNEVCIATTLKKFFIWYAYMRWHIRAMKVELAGSSLKLCYLSLPLVGRCLSVFPPKLSTQLRVIRSHEKKNDKSKRRPLKAPLLILGPTLSRY